MQFQVPQFLDVEDKIFGPLTLKQFLYLAGAGGASFIFFFVFQTWLWVVVTVLVGIIALGLAFGRFNGRPAIYLFLSAAKYAWQPKLYLWQYTTPTLELPKMHDLNRAEPAGSPLQNLIQKVQNGAALKK